MSIMSKKFKRQIYGIKQEKKGEKEHNHSVMMSFYQKRRRNEQDEENTHCVYNMYYDKREKKNTLILKYV